MKAAYNQGHTYRDRLTHLGIKSGVKSDLNNPIDINNNFGAYADLICNFYASRWPHSSIEDWQQRLSNGEIRCNGSYLEWRRPPWLEEAVPDKWDVIYDNNDLLVINKPSGLPVLPAGGFLEHTLLELLKKQYRADPQGLPKPVHRLGRFTSGLLVCARSSESRAWLSALLRNHQSANGCIKIYRALLQQPAEGSPLLQLKPGIECQLNTPIGLRPHGRLGTIWAAASTQQQGALPASSQLKLIEKQAAGWLVQLTIATGRPHQIRIHCAAAGAPLVGDPLYKLGGQACDQALPGDGGYQLHAHQLQIPLANGEQLNLEAPLPKLLQD